MIYYMITAKGDGKAVYKRKSHVTKKWRDVQRRSEILSRKRAVHP